MGVEVVTGRVTVDWESKPSAHYVCEMPESASCASAADPRSSAAAAEIDKARIDVINSGIPFCGPWP